MHKSNSTHATAPFHEAAFIRDFHYDYNKQWRELFAALWRGFFGILLESDGGKQEMRVVDDIFII